MTRLLLLLGAVDGFFAPIAEEVGYQSRVALALLLEMAGTTLAITMPGSD